MPRPPRPRPTGDKVVDDARLEMWDIECQAVSEAERDRAAARFDPRPGRGDDEESAS